MITTISETIDNSRNARKALGDLFRLYMYMYAYIFMNMDVYIYERKNTSKE